MIESVSMSKPTTVCPYCGKSLPSAEKLAWHLSRECEALATNERPAESSDKSSAAAGSNR